jgi:hypothetical protein
MGGLIARHFALALDGAADIRALIHLGAPFQGSVTAVTSLAPNHRDLAIDLGPQYRTMPGIYDLLPTYRCVDEGGVLRTLTPADIAAIGADPELAAASFAWRREFPPYAESPETPDSMTEYAVVGFDQPTPQCVRLADGRVNAGNFLYIEDGSAVDQGGDGVVPRFSATLPEVNTIYLPRRNGALANAPDVRRMVRTILTGI